MKFRILFLLACLLATSFLSANNAPAPFATSLPPSNDPLACNIPAPTNFHILAVGTDWIKFGWAPANAFDSHRIRTYRASDNFLLNTTITPPGALEAVIQPLPSGEACYGVINAICPDGSNSTNESISEIGTTLIIDLLVQGLILPDGSPVCSLYTEGHCDFPSDPNTMTAFKVYNKEKPDAFRKFGVMQTDADENTYRAFIDSNDEGNSPFYLSCENQNWPSNPDHYCSGPRQLEIWYWDGADMVNIAIFTAYEEGQDQISALDLLQLTDGFVIEQIEGEGQGEGEGDGKGRPGAPPTKSTMRESGNTPAAGSDLASASPNPFSELLEVYLPQNAVDQVQLQLFNLSGQKVLDQQFSGGQNQYTLSTQNLANGFYLLRIEADGNVQTLKVVKSE